MKTALSIVQDAMRLMGEPAPAALYGSTDVGVMQQIAILKSTLEQMRRVCWDVQKQKYSFSTEASRAQYPLPANFYKPIPRTHYNQSTDLELIQATDQDMAGLLYGDSGDESEYSYRIFGPDVTRTTHGQLEIHPTPSDVVTLSFEYYNANLIIPSTWAATDTVLYEDLAADSDVVPFDADIVKLGFRAGYRKENGGDYGTLEAEFRSVIDAAAARLTGNVRGSFAGKRAGPRYQTQYKGWTFT